MLERFERRRGLLSSEPRPAGRSRSRDSLHGSERQASTVMKLLRGGQRTGDRLLRGRADQGVVPYLLLGSDGAARGDRGRGECRAVEAEVVGLIGLPVLRLVGTFQLGVLV